MGASFNTTRLWVYWCGFSVALSALAETLDAPLTFIGWLLPFAGSLSILVLRPWGVRFMLPWLPWMFFAGASVVLFDFENAAHRFVILVTPLFVGAASSTLRLDARVAATFRRSLAFLVVVVLLVSLVAWNQAAADDVLLLAPHAILAVLLFWYFFVETIASRSVLAAVLCAAALAVPLLARTRAALAVIALLCIFGVSGLGRRARVVLGAAAGLAVAAALFLSQALVEKMLFDPSAGLTVENVRTSGRIVAWEILWRSVPDRLWAGHGANASQDVLLRVSSHFSHPHNDWLRLLYEYGVFGLALFVLGAFATSIALWRRASLDSVHDVGDMARPRLAAFALSLFGAMAALMVTDNVVLYAAFFGVPHMLATGLAIGSRRSLSPMHGTQARVP